MCCGEKLASAKGTSKEASACSSHVFGVCGDRLASGRCAGCTWAFVVKLIKMSRLKKVPLFFERGMIHSQKCCMRKSGFA